LSQFCHRRRNIKTLIAWNRRIRSWPIRWTRSWERWWTIVWMISRTTTRRPRNYAATSPWKYGDAWRSL